MIPGLPQGRKFAEAIGVFMRQQGIPVPDEFLSAEALKEVEDSDKKAAAAQEEERKLALGLQQAQTDKTTAEAQLAAAKAGVTKQDADTRLMNVEVGAFAAGESAATQAAAAGAPAAQAGGEADAQAQVAALRQQLAAATARIRELSRQQGGPPPEGP